MFQKIAVWALVAAVLGGGAYAIIRFDSEKQDIKLSTSTASENTGIESEPSPKTQSQPESSEPTPKPTPTPSPTTLPSLPPLPTPTAQSFIISADDYVASPSKISVKKGTKVTLVIRIKETNVYEAGLDYRSSVVNTGAIPPGQSKTVSFTASGSFELIPYWPSSGVKKDSVISVTVQ